MREWAPLGVPNRAPIMAGAFGARAGAVGASRPGRGGGASRRRYGGAQME
jgi:hypothetical protein